MDLQKKFSQWIGLGLVALIILFNIAPALGILLVVASVVIGLRYVIIKNNPTGTINAERLSGFNLYTLMQSGKKITLGIIGTIALIVILFRAIVIVDAGTVGVYSFFGKVRDASLPAGIHLINPLAHIIPMSVRTEQYTMSIAPGEYQAPEPDPVAALTKEGLRVDVDLTALYRLDPQKASAIYRTVGIDYEEKVIRSEIRSAVREVVANYEAKDLYSDKRQEAAQKIITDLAAKIQPRGVILEDILLRNVRLPAQLEQSIQDKLKAEQESQRYDFVLDREKKEAERKRIEAAGQRDSQKIISDSLTTNYLYYLYVNQLKDRQGTIYVPTSPGTGMPLFRDIGK
jgi:regulator of protease activity HflC (stomatin/prohibitin superfamily)